MFKNQPYSYFGVNICFVIIRKIVIKCCKYFSQIVQYFCIISAIQCTILIWIVINILA